VGKGGFLPKGLEEHEKKVKGGGETPGIRPGGPQKNRTHLVCKNFQRKGTEIEKEESGRPQGRNGREVGVLVVVFHSAVGGGPKGGIGGGLVTGNGEEGGSRKKTEKP